MSDTSQASLDLMSAKEAANRSGVLRTKIKQWHNEGLLIAVSRDNTVVVPEKLFEDDPDHPGRLRPLWNARGTILLLRDAGFDPEESLNWLFTYDDELEAMPIDALRSNRHKHVNRIAQSLGY